MITRAFHRWERRLAAATSDRIVRPFEWGLEWLPTNGHSAEGTPHARFDAWVSSAMADTGRFYDTPPTDAYRLDEDVLSFPSGLETPHPENNTVRARYFPAPATRGRARRAVVVLPQWNADANGHVGLCRLLGRFGVSTLRLTLPYHESRMPPELTRADYIVSANIGRTAQVCRQAVLDARRAAHWLRREGYERIGILGTSLGSCLAMLAAAHEPLIRVAALNHISPYFADVVWHGLSTAHVRAGLDGHIDLERLRRCWLPISPSPHLERMRGKRVLLVYARYDLSFPVHLSRSLVDEFRRRGLEHETAVLPCGHYSTGVTPFNWMDGLVLARFLNRRL
ncbi:MAG: alpha/beta hydrolase family protein [Acidobacteria bacterium]|nr:alpha/beta hydrolase family protein [Acidobacteriota bacterium]